MLELATNFVMKIHLMAVMVVVIQIHGSLYGQMNLMVLLLMEVNGIFKLELEIGGGVMVNINIIQVGVRMLILKMVN